MFTETEPVAMTKFLSVKTKKKVFRKNKTNLSIVCLQYSVISIVYIIPLQPKIELYDSTVCLLFFLRHTNSFS